MESVHVYHRTRTSGNEIACPRSRLRNTELVRLMTAFDQAIVVQCDKSRASIIERSTRNIIIINTQSRIMNKQSEKVKIKANAYSEIKIQTASVAKLFTKEKRLYKVQELQKSQTKTTLLKLLALPFTRPTPSCWSNQWHASWSRASNHVLTEGIRKTNHDGMSLGSTEKSTQVMHLNIYFLGSFQKVNRKAGFELKVEKNYNESPQFVNYQGRYHWSTGASYLCLYHWLVHDIPNE